MGMRMFGFGRAIQAFDGPDSDGPDTVLVWIFISHTSTADFIDFITDRQPTYVGYIFI